MGRKMRRIPAAVPAVTLSIAVVATMTACGSDGGSKDTSEKAAREFLTAWQAGDTAKAAGLTDSPKTAQEFLTNAKGQLGISKAEYKAGAYTKAKDGQPATLAYSATLTLSGAPEPITFDSSVPVTEKDGKTVVRWTSTIVHPKLTEGAKIKRERSLPERGQIQDRFGKPLVTTTPVVKLSLWPSKINEPEKLYQALSNPVFDRDINKLKAEVAKSNPEHAVFVVTLRKENWEKTGRALLRGLNGVIVEDGVQQTTDVAPQLVGSTATANADTLKNAGPAASQDDTVGVSGLQYRYQQVLAGTPTIKVSIVDASNTTVETLVDVKGKPAEAIKTSLDPAIQKKAEAALAGLDKNAGLVAIDTKTGGILAAANNPPKGSNRAFVGQYPPGSTFKAVSSAALIKAGLKVTDPAPCPNTVVVNGQTFKNYDGLQPMPDATFERDFAESCNTSFINARGTIGDSTLNETAKQMFGIGETWDVGANTFDGSVPKANSENDKAASMIGQGRVLASPLVMASVAATIESGKFNQPVLVPDQTPKKVASHDLDPAVAAQLKTLMRGVVANGSGKILQGIPGTVGAKTGTAEFTENGELLTHAWMIGFRDNVAVAVIVEKGGSGGRVGGPILKAFLGSL